MKVKQWLVINKNGIVKIRKSKPGLSWNEIAMQLNIEIPNELFQRPTIEATLHVKDIPNTGYIVPEVVIQTKELIEQQTGAKIDFKVIPYDSEEKVQPESPQEEFGGEDGPD
jgi:hypothetical protein